MSFVLILLAVTVYSLLHSLLASLQAKQKMQEWLGPRASRAYRLVYNLVALITLLPVLALVVLLPDKRLYAIPWPWVLLSLLAQTLAALALVGGVLQTGAGSFLGIQQIAQTPEDPAPRLVVQGLYRWVRHPLYTAGLILIWLLPLMTANWLAFNLAMTAYVLIGIRFEERKLLGEFGIAYETYRHHTPMLIPWKLPPKA